MSVWTRRDGPVLSSHSRPARVGGRPAGGLRGGRRRRQAAPGRPPCAATSTAVAGLHAAGREAGRGRGAQAAHTAEALRPSARVTLRMIGLGLRPRRAGRAHGGGAAAGRARDAALGRRGRARTPGGRAAGARVRGVPGRAGAADRAARGHGGVLGLHRAPGARPERHDSGLPLPGAAWLGWNRVWASDGCALPGPAAVLPTLLPAR